MNLSFSEHEYFLLKKKNFFHKFFAQIDSFIQILCIFVPRDQKSYKECNFKTDMPMKK